MLELQQWRPAADGEPALPLPDRCSARLLQKCTVLLPLLCFSIPTKTSSWRRAKQAVLLRVSGSSMLTRHST